MKKLGINKISAKIFRGYYKNKLYPDNYTNEEIEHINNFKDNQYQINKNYINGEMYTITGKMCWAGSNFFKIEVNGDAYRCASTLTPIGNIYKNTLIIKDKPTPCTANKVLTLTQCLNNLSQSKK